MTLSNNMVEYFHVENQKGLAENLDFLKMIQPIHRGYWVKKQKGLSEKCIIQVEMKFS